MAGGSSPPVPPRQGHPPCTLPALQKTYLSNFFPHVDWESEREPTGVMKMQKKAGQESELSCRFFLIFPGCFCIRLAVFYTAQPVARSAGTQFAKMQSSFAKGFLRGGSAAANSQSFNRSFAKICVCDAPFHRETVCVKQIANSGFGSRGDAPCGGGGGKAPPWSPHAPPGNCMKDTVCCIRNWVQGTALVQGRSPAWFLCATIQCSCKTTI